MGTAGNTVRAIDPMARSDDHIDTWASVSETAKSLDTAVQAFRMRPLDARRLDTHLPR